MLVEETTSGRKFGFLREFNRIIGKEVEERKSWESRFEGFTERDVAAAAAMASAMAAVVLEVLGRWGQKREDAVTTLCV